MILASQINDPLMASLFVAEVAETARRHLIKMEDPFINCLDRICGESNHPQMRACTYLED